MKPTVVDAWISIGWPVAGFRPVRADRLFFVNVPNPTIVTDWSCLTPLVMQLITATRAREASAFDSPSYDATASISCPLFMKDSSRFPLKT